ncbi:phospholipase D-like domain-containing protein [Bdellovibrio sp. HCB337]|uniref:phospholipase D-like domain-containing protein n=1 Tax=Bdellovibrio sp. HCB337 TaxID=3394358 RepID=UPI0039A520E4
MKLILFSVILLNFLSACSVVETRAPSSVDILERNKAQKIQEIDFNLAQLYNRIYELNRKLDQLQKTDNEKIVEEMDLKREIEKIKNQTVKLQEERKELERSLSLSVSSRAWQGVGPWFEVQTLPNPNQKNDLLEIEGLKGFEITNASTSAAFALDTKAFGGYRLELKNKLSAEVLSEGREDTTTLAGRLECNDMIEYEDGALFFKTKKRRLFYEFIWYNTGQNIVVGFTPGVTSCRLLFKFKNAKAWTHQMNLVSLDKLIPSAKEFHQHLEVCARPTGFSEKDPVSFFWQQDYNQVTCPRPFDKIEMLRNPIKAFNAKIRGLTGSDVPQEAYQQKNPLVRLDFSKAPKLDFIWVSSLNFSADFYGTVLAQALRYHADKGAQVRILVPEATTFEKDKRILSQLLEGRPNVKLQYYQYHFTNGKDGSWFDKFHRVNHVKLLIGYSEKDPQKNFLVSGGRNIRDSYLFRDKPAYTRYPWLVDYARGEKPFVYYDDFEVEVRGTDFIKSVLAQMLQFWNKDEKTNIVRSTNLNVSRPMDPAQSSYFKNLSQQTPVVRHVLSIPYADNYQLEKFYVEMFDSAQKEILLTTPYFRPSEAISEALVRAAKRGVKIKILTRIQLAGDDVPKIAEDVNKKGVNRHFRDVEMYEWVEPKSIMHAKLLLIDQKLSFVSSVNMNIRSFTHDTEAGVLILHEGTAIEFRKEVMAYFNNAHRLSEELKIKWLNGKLIDIFDSYF